MRLPDQASCGIVAEPGTRLLDRLMKGPVVSFAQAQMAGRVMQAGKSDDDGGTGQARDADEPLRQLPRGDERVVALREYAFLLGIERVEAVSENP
ncbi:hypothetical protein FB007_101279 [Sinorhizobium medicae]|nr:hypothetical protein [Sinorhizobium medicae]TWA42120.1 hypothetical protein FB007_101279 [Sinorhizobium medicae]